MANPNKPLNNTPWARYLEPAATIGSAFLAEPVAGIAGLTASIIPGKEGQGAEMVDWTREALTYTPRTEAGMQGLQELSGGAVGDVGRSSQALTQKSGDLVYGLTGSETAGAIAQTLPTALLQATGLGAMASPARATRVTGQTMKRLRAAQELNRRAATKGVTGAQMTTAQDFSQP